VCFATITLYVASERLIPKVSIYFVMAQSGNFWIHLRRLFKNGYVDIKKLWFSSE
jgi:hypothetical protein